MSDELARIADALEAIVECLVVANGATTTTPISMTEAMDEVQPARRVEATPPEKKKATRGYKKMEYTQVFQDFWDIYPRKKSKADAFSAWAQTIDEHPADLGRRVERFAAYWQKRKHEIKYCPYPATWLRAHGWSDQIPATSSRPGEDGVHNVSVGRILDEESISYYASPGWREYKELVSAGKIEPGFRAWQDSGCNQK